MKLATLSLASALAYPLLAESLSFVEGQAFLRKYCQGCHTGKAGAGGFALDQVATESSFIRESHRWTSLLRRVHAGEMPPKNAPSPPIDGREAFVVWGESVMRQVICAGGIEPGRSPLRRLNRDEYSATIRDLLDIQIDVGQMLPVDGGGGEGFDNAAETLFLSPIHSEKYLEAARAATEFAVKEFKSRQLVLIAKPGPAKSEAQAAREILGVFLPRAFRRPVTDSEIAPYLGLFHTARRHGLPFEEAVFFSIRAVLASPLFLFRTEPPNLSAAVRPVDGYALASRISYFLWGSMPDEFLMDAAASGQLHQDSVLRFVVGRMLRNDRSLGFAQRFVDQWLGLRDLDGVKKPDAKLYPMYDSDEELRSDIRLQPVLYFREMLVRDRPLTELIDSRHTIGTSNLSKFFEKPLAIRREQAKQPQWVELEEGSTRGGLLGMPAVLAVSSYPYRTSPVLRGAWILDAILGTPPPPPPPDVPPLEEPPPGAAPKSMRERLAQHRSNAVCASCHSRIDGPGFALENYDVLGRWRDTDGGLPIDNSGEIGDTKFHGPAELKAVLLERKDLFLRNVATKMLGYALGRGLTVKDSCAVDAIVAEVKNKGYRTQALVEAIILSPPFRYQSPALKLSSAIEKETGQR
jgi:hypothetical protein